MYGGGVKPDIRFPKKRRYDNTLNSYIRRHFMKNYDMLLGGGR